VSLLSNKESNNRANSEASLQKRKFSLLSLHYQLVNKLSTSSQNEKKPSRFSSGPDGLSQISKTPANGLANFKSALSH
jgi:hypothetical protein